MTRKELETLSEEELDDLVYEAKGDEAATINNNGKDAQLDYLVGPEHKHKWVGKSEFLNTP